ncbi:golgin candidate 1 isoform X6 [Gossypium hirsutum]|uniref:Golgin candidate 1 isoform X6 n=1 Tax=Gossypium hirsutum TaxID=3635 RepID=A0ABM3A0B9_GOSHI|nr:golgin candidate 1-like isoform X6 [Gossypium hirsutum]XP_040948330.1 golgin candidate 1-like isoform X6 [Gossypium hirsutum]
MEARFRRGQKKSPEEANQMLQEEVERARQGQRDAESKLSSLEAKVQKMRVEMAAMKRDAEHYSRQVFQRRKMLRIDGLCKKMGYKDAKLLMLYGGRSSINRLISVSLT